MWSMTRWCWCVRTSVEDIVHNRGGVPATVAVLGGRVHVGLAPDQLEALARAGPMARKCSSRDLGVAIAQGANGATTVASTAYLASRVGIRVFVTGGMGGVHRGAETTFDVSADLSELARTPIVVVCAGIKTILDVEKTLEVLETNGVPVISYGTDEFPAFFSPSSGVPAPLRLNTPSEVAAAAKAGFDLGMRNGMVVAVPNPSPMSGGNRADASIRIALEEARREGVVGRDITPFLLAKVNEQTGGESLKSNIALVRHNAVIGTDIAIELAMLDQTENPGSGPPLSTPAGHSVHSTRLPTRTWISSPERSQFLPGVRGCDKTGSKQVGDDPTLSSAPLCPRTRVAVFGGAVADTVAMPCPGAMLTLATSTPGQARQSFGGVGRNIAEGVARVLGNSGRVHGADPDAKTPSRDHRGDGKGAEVTLVSVVGADEAGRAIVKDCEGAGVRTVATAHVGPQATTTSDENDNRENSQGVRSDLRTASYTAILAEDGDLVAAVADMRVFKTMTRVPDVEELSLRGMAHLLSAKPLVATAFFLSEDFVDRHSSVVDQANLAVSDGNLPPDGLAQLARLCAMAGVPLVFEPTSVGKSCAPFSSQAITQIALITPNLDELAAMAMAAQETIQRGPTNASINFITGPVAAKDSRKFVEAFSKDKEPPAPDATATATATAPQSCKREEGGRVRVGHELAQQVIVDGKLVDTKPLGAALASVLRAMLLPEDMVEEDASTASTHLRGGTQVRRSTIEVTTPTKSEPQALWPRSSSLLDGAKHIVVTMGSAGVLLVSARPIPDLPHVTSTTTDTERVVTEAFVEVTADHFPALPLVDQDGKSRTLVDCTGAGDCLVAGLVGGLALGWAMRDSMLLGMLCARESIQVKGPVPASLGRLLATHGRTPSSNANERQVFLQRLPEGYTPLVVSPWEEDPRSA